MGKFREDTGVVWTHSLSGIRRTEKTYKADFVVPDNKNIKTYQTDNYRDGRKIPFDYLQIQEYEPENSGIIKELLMTHQVRTALYKFFKSVTPEFFKSYLYLGLFCL